MAGKTDDALDRPPFLIEGVASQSPGFDVLIEPWERKSPDYLPQRGCVDEERNPVRLRVAPVSDAVPIE